MRDADRYLLLRGSRYHYTRRVPVDYEGLDSRNTIRVSLKTTSLETARARRDELERADDLYWEALAAGTPEDKARARYDAAVLRARSMGLRYMPAEEIAALPIAEIRDRFARLTVDSRPAEIEAVLGLAAKPKVKVSEAYDTYLAQIAVAEVANKSEAQRKMWQKVKRRAVSNFVAVCGDPPVDEITRAQGQEFYQWWLERTRQGLSGSAANRDVGNMRKFFREWMAYQGEELPNPFRDLRFGEIKRSRPPFPADWIRDEILKPGALASLNEPARHIVYTLIETGARPSEICNLDARQIRLDHAVPHLSIEPTDEREIKTSSSVRMIPLVGVSLEAMKRNPEGFPRYRDKEIVLSKTVNKAFRTNALMPTGRHVVYSLRHSFEDRMAEAGIDYGMRMALMGHSTDRPKYGSGASLEYRRDQLMKIVLPFDPALFDA